MAYIFKLSKPLYDILTCDDKNLILNSELACLKTKMQGTGNVSVTAAHNHAPWEGYGYVDINHGLGFVPMFRTFVTVTGRTYETPHREDGGEILIKLTAFADSTKLRIILNYQTVYGQGETTTRTYKYYIFANKLE